MRCLTFEDDASTDHEWPVKRCYNKLKLHKK